MNKKYIKHGIIILLCLVVAVGGYMTAFSMKKNNNANEQSNFVEVPVKRGSIKVTASGSGSVQASLRKEIKTLDNGGIVDSILIEEGQFVKEGDLILTFESGSTDSMIDQTKLDLALQENKLDSLISELEELKVYAEESGYVGEIAAKVGDVLSKGYVLTTITDKSRLNISGFFNKVQIENISLGDKAEVTLPDYLTKIDGVVTKINETPQPTSSGAILYEVIVEIENPGGISEGTKGLVTIKNVKGTFSSVEHRYLEMRSSKEVKLNTGGEIMKLNVSSGDYVEKGELLAELKNIDLERQIEDQKIAIEKKRLELTEKLKGLDENAVYAPISGTVTKINITEGERVSSNSILAVISDLNHLQVVIPIDELDINKVEVGQKAIVTAQAVPDVDFDAQVSKVALEGNSSGGVTTYDVTLTLNNIDGLKPGMTANGEIIVDSKKNALLVPNEAVQQRRNQKMVLVKDEDSDEQMKSVPIKIGLVSADYVEVIEGLNEGDIVLYRITGSTGSQNSPRGMGIVRFAAPPGGGMGGRRQ